MKAVSPRVVGGAPCAELTGAGETRLSLAAGRCGWGGRRALFLLLLLLFLVMINILHRSTIDRR